MLEEIKAKYNVYAESNVVYIISYSPLDQPGETYNKIGYSNNCSNRFRSHVWNLPNTRIRNICIYTICRTFDCHPTEFDGYYHEQKIHRYLRKHYGNAVGPDIRWPKETYRGDFATFHQQIIYQISKNNRVPELLRTKYLRLHVDWMTPNYINLAEEISSDSVEDTDQDEDYVD